MKKIILLAAVLLAAATVSAQKIEKDVLGADGLRSVTVTPDNVCSKQIDITLKGDVIESVRYTRGCEGNAKGVGALIKGMTIDEAIKRLDGITCKGSKTGKTSCPDQLAGALKQIKKSKPQKAK